MSGSGAFVAAFDKNNPMDLVKAKPGSKMSKLKVPSALSNITADFGAPPRACEIL